MKILYLANIRIPSEKGETLQIVKMCDALSRVRIRTHMQRNAPRDRNMDVELIIPKRINKTLKNKNPYTYFGVHESFVIRKLATIDLMPLRKYVGKFAYRLNYWLFIKAAVRHAKTHTPDIIYSRDWRIINKLANSGAKLVYELHDFREQDADGYKSVVATGAHIVVITKGLKAKLVDIGISEEYITVSPDAVDIREFDIPHSKRDAREALNLNQKKELVIYTGHLFDWKGVYTLADSSKFFPKDRELVLVGGLSEDVTRMKEYCMKNNLNNVQVLGHKPYTDMPSYLKASDVLILSDSVKYDISREYTSPLKLFQYMVAKRPIVAPKTPALLEILNKSNAWLYTPDDAEAIAESVEKAFSQSKDSEAHVASAWELVQEYTWEKRAKNILLKIENEK